MRTAIVPLLAIISAVLAVLTIIFDKPILAYVGLGLLALAVLIGA